MKKKIILSLVIVNLLVAVTAFVGIRYSYYISGQTNFLNDNQIRMYNSKGFTLEQMSALEQMNGVDKAIFDNRNIKPSFTLESENGVISISGDSIEEDNQAQKDLDFIAGTYLTDIYQVIITQTLADVLIEQGLASDYQDLIGKDMVKGLEIVGVYPDNKISNFRYINYHVLPPTEGETEYVESGDKEIDHGFMMFNRGKEYESELLIRDYNNNLAYNYEQKNYDKNINSPYVFTYNDSDPANDDGPTMVNYEESVANGAEGLIDPETKAYGDEFNQYGFITTSGDRDSLVAEISDFYPDAAIVTSDTKLNDIQGKTFAWIKFITFAIILEMFIFIPMIKNSK